VTGEASIQALPTIVLISGQLTLTDGSVVDSRQSAPDDKTAEVLRTAISGCAEWWSAVSSIVIPTLDDPESGFAVVLGQRSIVRASLDGETRRSRLAKFLRGPVGSVSVIRSYMGKPLPDGYRNLARLQGSDMGYIGARFDDPMPRWCFVDEGNDYLLRLVVNRIGARIIVDTTGGLPACEASSATSIDYCAPFACPYLVIVPDTARMRDRIGDLLAGRLDPLPYPQRAPEVSEAPPYAAIKEIGILSGKRTERSEVGAAGEFEALQDDELWRVIVDRFDAHRRSSSWFSKAPRYLPGTADFLRFPVVSAECSVSGLLREGQWGDAAGLEAARMLLLKRFDLKLGLWDLALNPVLRSTVLDALPVQDVPAEAVQIPAFAWKQAERRNEDANVRAGTPRHAHGDIYATLLQALQALTPIRWRITFGRLWLPLTEPLGTADRLGLDPLVELEIRVNKSSTRVVVSHQFCFDLDISAYIEKRREAFAAVGLPPASTKNRTSSGDYPLSAVLWTANVGWGDADADWSNIAKAIADRTKQWVGLLADFVASCREIRRAKHNWTTNPDAARRWHTPRLDTIQDGGSDG
jgi:hypothetical protein